MASVALWPLVVLGIDPSWEDALDAMVPVCSRRQTAATLHEQSKQMEKIVDDLDEIEFSMKRAGVVIRDITRGVMTDK